MGHWHVFGVTASCRDVHDLVGCLVGRAMLPMGVDIVNWHWIIMIRAGRGRDDDRWLRSLTRLLFAVDESETRGPYLF